MFLKTLLEKAALHQIIDYIEAKKLLLPYQSAYRQNHGVGTAMITMYSDLLNAIDNNHVTLVVTIDLSAAFDIVLQIFHED